MFSAVPEGRDNFLELAIFVDGNVESGGAVGDALGLNHAEVLSDCVVAGVTVIEQEVLE